MNNIDRSYRFGFIGTTCAGKTTLAYDTVAQLKRVGYNADGVINQDRRLPFDRKYLDEDLLAQYWTVFNQMAKLCEVGVGRPNKIVVTDRTPIDLYAYLKVTFSPDPYLWNLIRNWTHWLYDAVYYLEPLELKQDGARPDNEFRMEVDDEIQNLCSEVPNVRFIKREQIHESIIEQVEQ